VRLGVGMRSTMCYSSYIFYISVLTAVFVGEPGLAGVYWSKGWWKWWWQLSSYKSCKAPVKSLPPTNQHPVFYRPDALPVAQPTVSKHWGEILAISVHELSFLYFCVFFMFQSGLRNDLCCVEWDVIIYYINHVSMQAFMFKGGSRNARTGVQRKGHGSRWGTQPDTPL